MRCHSFLLVEGANAVLRDDVIRSGSVRCDGGELEGGLLFWCEYGRLGVSQMAVVGLYSVLSLRNVPQTAISR